MAKRALIIGIETYLDEKIPKVDHAAADAEAFAEAIQAHGFRADDQVVHLDGQATKTLLHCALKQLFRGVTSDDTLFVYFAGHGLSLNGRNVLLCHDSVHDQLDETGIELQTLLAAARASDCQRVAFFFDCCHGGLPIDEAASGVVATMDEDELSQFVESSQSHVVFASCRSDETSHSHPSLQHGLWLHHLIEALSGEAAEACVRDTLITSASLQSYLSAAVPSTWRKLFTTKCGQTPRLWGGQDYEFVIGDIAPILAAKASTAGRSQARQVSLLYASGGRIKELSGFQKRFHTVPDRASDSAEAFVHKLASDELQKDIDEVFDSVRSHMDYRRKDLTVDGPTGGSASIITPDFEYTVAASQDRETPGDYQLRQSIGNFEDNAIMMDEGFLEVFGSRFDTLVFEPNHTMDVTYIVDQLESKAPQGISLRYYDSDCTRCEIEIEGLGGDVVVDARSVRVIFRGRTSPAQMLESFAAVFQQLSSNISDKVLP
jgi:hypothetical protein